MQLGLYLGLNAPVIGGALANAFNVLAQTGHYALTGHNVTLGYDRTIEPETGGFLIVGHNIDLVYDRSIDPDTGNHSLNGYNVDLTLSGGGLALVGNAYTGITFTNVSYICMPDTDTAILVNNTDDENQAFDWDGADFTSIGTPDSFTIGNNVNACRLGAGGFLVTGDDTNFQEKSFNGSTFSDVGSSFSVGNDSKVYASSATRFFANNRGNNRLEVWDKIAGTWTMVASLPVSYSFVSHTLCVVDRTVDAEIVAVWNYVTDDIRLYTYNGSSLSYVTGSSLTFSGAGASPSMARLNDGLFAYCDSGKLVTLFETDGSTITEGASIDVEAEFGITVTQPIINETPTDDTLILAGRNTGTIAFLQLT